MTNLPYPDENTIRPAVRQGWHELFKENVRVWTAITSLLWDWKIKNGLR